MLKTDPNDLAKTLTKFASFLRLVGTVERRCQSMTDPDAVRFNAATNTIKGAFHNVNLTTNWTNVTQAIRPSDTNLLYFAAQYLDRKREEAVVDETTLREIDESAATLAKEVADGNLAEHLKVVILDQLDSIRAAIDDYTLRGAEGLKKALAESTGMIILEGSAFAKEQGNPSVTRFWDLLTKINTAVRAAQLAYQLGDAVGKVIEMLPPHSA